MKALALFAVVFFTACGSDRPKQQRRPVRKAPPDPQEQIEFTTQIKPLIDKYCIMCHATSDFVSSPAAYKASASRTLIQNGSMPPSSSRPGEEITAQERFKMVSFGTKIDSRR